MNYIIVLSGDKFKLNILSFRNVASCSAADAVTSRGCAGLIPTVVAVINDILVPIRRMRLTRIEYVLLQAIIFYDPGKCGFRFSYNFYSFCIYDCLMHSFMCVMPCIIAEFLWH